MSHSLPLISQSSQLERVLDQNEAVKDTVEKSANELCVIHAVLQQEVPDHAQTGDVALALKKAQHVEARIQEAADELAEVNQILREELGAREVLEQKLASTRAALEQAHVDSAASVGNIAD